jgi:ketosteroid isomerase-like protein
MSMRLALSLVLILAAAPAFAKPVYNAPADVQAVTQLEKKNAAELDMGQLLAGYAPDLVVYDLIAPGLYKGRAQFVKNVQPQLAAVKSLTLSLPSINVLSDGTMACAAVQMHFDTVFKNGSTSSVGYRQLDVLRRLNGKWQVVEEQLSFPADPKTGLSLPNAPQTAVAPIEFSTDPFAGRRVSVATAKAQIKDWVVRFAVATNLDDTMALMGPGDDEVIFDMFSTVPLQGRQAITAAYAPLVARMASVAVSFPDFRADSDGYIGAQIDTQKLVIKMKDGSTVNWLLRQSDCLHNVGGHWFSVFDELSFPMDPKTGKAVMN